MNRFDRLFWRRLWKLAKPYWGSEQKWVALGLLAGTLVLSGVVKGGNVVFSYVNRDMMTALANKNAPEFFHSGILILLYNIRGSADVTAQMDHDLQLWEFVRVVVPSAPGQIGKILNFRYLR